MTSFHGGKQRIGKQIAKVIFSEALEIEEDEDFVIKGYCEPFCGMLGVYQHIPDWFQDHKPKLVYKAGDDNKSIILMWKSAQKGWEPPSKCTEAEYVRLKNTRPSAKKGFVGYQYSFGGQFFKGYSLKYDKTKDATSACKRVKSIAKKLSNVKFTHGDYRQFSNLKGYLIYCDPPYSRTECRYQEKFDHEEFWDWCEEMSEHNIVFISEYSAPKGTRVVWKKMKASPYNGSRLNTGVEKLFML